MFKLLHNYKKIRPLHPKWLPLLAIVSLLVEAAFAQQPGIKTTVARDVLQPFKDNQIIWMTNIWAYANRLFGILALIELAWSLIVLALEKSDFQSWASAFIKKVMWIGVFYTLLINGRQWIPAIIDSFSQIGSKAAQLKGPIQPSDIFAQGLNIASTLMARGQIRNLPKTPGP
jgi:type IV secretion system protein TrbL